MAKDPEILGADSEKLARFYEGDIPDPQLRLHPELFAAAVARRIYSEWRPSVEGILSINCPYLGFEEFIRDETHYECERRQKAGQTNVWTRGYQGVRDDVLRALVRCAVDFFSKGNDRIARFTDRRNLRCDLSPWMKAQSN